MADDFSLKARDIPVAPPEPPPPPAPSTTSAAALLKAALDHLNHPSNLDLQSRLDAIQRSINVMGTQLMPLLPTE